MSEDKVKRFTGIQIALHWCQALLYLTLLVTGGAILLRRLAGVVTPPESILPIVHRLVGVGLLVVLAQMLIAAAVTRRLRVLGRDILEWFLLYPRDVLWLIKAPLSVVIPSLRMPAAGRYNAGQKLHGAFVSLAVTTFIVTGMAMMIVPGVLIFWAIHASVFLVAVVFLCLHLFMTLVNPATRRAIGGMFTGFVPRHYAESHHPMWIDSSPAGREAKPAPAASIKAVAIVVVLLAAGAGAAFYFIGADRIRAAADRWLSREPVEAILPGPLIAAHAAVIGNDCLACHRMTARPPSEACLTCHSKIAGLLEARAGYHGKLTGPCRDCHTEHKGRDANLRPLDANAFNHALARFALEGKHQRTACRKCHEKPTVGDANEPGRARLRYVGLAFDKCTDCHASPHAGTASNDRCTRCHSTMGWGLDRLTFLHSRDAGFVLDGAHAAAACRKCHTPRGRGEQWLSERVGAPVTPATSSARSGSTEDTFLLDGLGRTCASCHHNPHVGQLKPPCTRCHTTAGWTGEHMRFRHGPDNPPILQGAHAALACGRCHKSKAAPASTPASRGSHEGAPSAIARAAFHISDACVSCHADPHEGLFGKACTDCHSQTGWGGSNLKFRHGRDTGIVLVGAHADLPCTSCHDAEHKARPGWLDAEAPPEPACKQCHRDPHGYQFSAGCGTCHSQTTFASRGLKFSHERNSTFKINSLHAGLGCASCHKPLEGIVVYKPLPDKCAGCHTAVADAMAGKVMMASTGGAATTQPASKPAASAGPSPHDGRVKCTDCHATDRRTTSAAQHAARCAGCHNARYRDLYFDWSRSLADRLAKAEAAAAKVAKTDPDKAAAMVQRIAAARKVGMHNIRLAQDLLDGIISAGRS